MTTDLEELLHRHAATPTTSIDPSALAARGRRRRQRRQAVMGAVAAVAVLGLGFVALPFDRAAPIELADAAADGDGPAVPDEKVTPVPIPPPVVDELGQALGSYYTYGPGGLTVVGEDTLVRSTEPVAEAYAVSSGVVFQPTDSDEILYAPIDGEVQVAVPATGEELIQLHGARTIEGGIAVLFSRFEPPPADDPTGSEQVVYTRVIGGAEREVGRFPNYEAFTEAVTWDGQGVVGAICYVQCTLARMDQAGTPAALPPGELDEAYLHALHAVDERYVIVASAPLDAEDTGLELLVVDAGTGAIESRTPLGLDPTLVVGEVAVHPGPADGEETWVVSTSLYDETAEHLVRIDVQQVVPAAGDVSTLAHDLDVVIPTPSGS